MAQTSQPWDGTATGDASVAPYSSQEWSDMYKYLFMASKSDEGPFLGSGTSPDVGLTVQVTNPVSASVEVTAGAATVDGTFYRSSATEALAIGANASGNPRIDTIILRKDVAAQTIRLAVLAGTPAATPVAASLTQTPGVMWEIPLADVAVANGFATIAAGDITPRRHFVGMPDAIYLQDILNNSGGILQTGDLVVWDYTADRAVKTSTTANDGTVAGVWVGRTASGGYGRLLVDGVGLVRTNAAATPRGARLTQSTTAKQAAINGLGASVGYVLATTAGAGLCIARVALTKATARMSYYAVVGLGITSATFADTDATNHKITIIPRGSRVKVSATIHIFMATTASPTTAELTIYSVGLAAIGGDATHGLANIPSNSAYDVITRVAIEWIFDGLTPGTSQEFRIRWRSTNGAGNVQALSPVVTMLAEEL